MFNLEVEVAREPVVEEGLVDVACGFQLCSDPVLILVTTDVHGDVVHLSRPHKPVALQKPKKKIYIKNAITTKSHGKVTHLHTQTFPRTQRILINLNNAKELFSLEYQAMLNNKPEQMATQL